MYNCELSTLTEKQEDINGVFQRNIQRKLLNIGWPEKLSNSALYGRKKYHPGAK